MIYKLFQALQGTKILLGNKYLTTLILVLGYSLTWQITQALEQPQDPQYGNGQGSGFIKAMYGRSADLSPAEIQEIYRTIPAKNLNNTNCYLFRLGVSKSSRKINNLQNSSLHPTLRTAVVANPNQLSNGKKSGEIAIGYKFKQATVEVELLLPENLQYNQEKLFKNQPGALSSRILTRALLLNGYYDLISSQRFRIFVGAGMGGILHNINANFNNHPASSGESLSKTSINLAYNAILGFKFILIPQLSINFTTRYINFTGFGKATWIDPERILLLKGNHRAIGYGINLIHVFI